MNYNLQPILFIDNNDDYDRSLFITKAIRDFLYFQDTFIRSLNFDLSL